MSTERIEKLRKKLDDSIEKHGLNSKETRKISLQMDELINKYYSQEKQYGKSNILKIKYDLSIEKLKKITIDFCKFPSIEEWNYYAKENILLNSESIKYISGLNWNKLRDRIKAEINSKK